MKGANKMANIDWKDRAMIFCSKGVAEKLIAHDENFKKCILIATWLDDMSTEDAVDAIISDSLICFDSNLVDKIIDSGVVCTITDVTKAAISFNTAE